MNETKLHPYQLQAVNHILTHTHCGLFLDMGLGKTISTLTAVNILMYKDLDINNVLIVAPKRVVESVWDAEISKWQHVNHLTISKITGTAKQRRAALRESADIHLISRDNIAWLCGQYGGSSLPFDMLVIDELSSFKNNNAVRFKALRQVQPCFKRVVGLTGTPAPNGLIDLWAQMYLLDRGERLEKFITQYRFKYFTAAGTNGKVVYKYALRSHAEQTIYSKISDICISMKAADYLQLPGTVINDIQVTLPPDIQAKYDVFEKEKVLELLAGQDEGETISAVNAAALSNKLLQFANGAVYDENHDYHIIHNAKIEAAKELIEDANGKPVLIARGYLHDNERLIHALKKYNPRELKNDQDIKDWNAGKIQVLIMHPASGGHGLNLQAGGHIILWFAQTWSLELYEQFNARLNRQGQTNTVIINKLIACKTIDEDVAQAILHKTKGQNSLMEAVKARINKYKNLKL
jgi:SNF2 family DNA or RNA helicase